MKLFWAMIFSVLCLVPEIIAEETRILMDSYINGQRVTLAFDTGAEGPMLLRKTAKRLNLSITEAPDDVIVQPGQIKLALTEKCKFQLHEGGVENDIHFAVVDIPSYIDFEFEGFLGWGAIKHMMIEIDPSSHRLKARETLNFDKTEWKCLDILKDENVLIIKTSEEDETQDLLLIDTGHSDGLAIKSELWQQLVDDANDFHTTLSASYLPSVGLVVDKEIWIPEIRFGRLALHDIPATNGFEAVEEIVEAVKKIVIF